MPNPPRTEIVLPSTTTQEIAEWASQVQELGPALGNGRITVEVIGELFMGLELAFRDGERTIHSLALFADVPDQNEIEIMEAGA
jgi:hypothetical protein